jgi:hypothetical protein
MTGTLSGVPVNLMMWLAARLRERRVNWWSFFRTEREALEPSGYGSRSSSALSRASASRSLA